MLCSARLCGHIRYLENGSWTEWRSDGKTTCILTINRPITILNFPMEFIAGYWVSCASLILICLHLLPSIKDDYRFVGWLSVAARGILAPGGIDHFGALFPSFPHLSPTILSLTLLSIQK